MPAGSSASEHTMVDYALMNQCLYEGKAQNVEQMTKDALADGRKISSIISCMCRRS
jgi:hypothetical protein